MDRTHSLAFFVALWTAGAIAGAMGLYAGYQYFTTPDATVAQLLLRHAWHVALLGGLVYVVLLATLRRRLLLPIRRLSGHLYRIGTGHLAPVPVQARIRELRAVESGINLMLERMRQRALDELREAQDDLDAPHEQAAKGGGLGAAETEGMRLERFETGHRQPVPQE